jgi:hypothetical protein
MNQGAYKAGVKIGSFFLGIAGGVKLNNDVKAENQVRITTTFTCAHCGEKLKAGKCPNGCVDKSFSRHDRSNGRREK